MKGLINRRHLMLLTIALVVLGALLLSACSNPTTTAPAAPPATAKPAATAAATTPAAPAAAAPLYGGTLKKQPAVGFGPGGTLGWPSEFTGVAYTSAQPCLDTLVRINAQGEIVPQLATSWKVADDKKSVAFTLRQGVKFHDGTDFNATAVKFNLDAQIAAKKAPYLTSVEVVDESTVQVNLKSYQNYLFANLTSGVGMMVSPTAFAKNGVEWMRLNPVGTGPFKFDSWQRDVKVRYVKNENYWQKGKPYLDALEFVLVSDETTGLINLKAGNADVFQTQMARNAADMKGTPGFKVIFIPNATAMLWPDSGNADSPFANLKVRQAVDYALDKEAMAQAVQFGLAGAAYQPPPSYSIGYLPNLTPVKYDTGKAKQLLTEAGYPNGFNTTITAGPDANKDLLSSIQGYLKDAGIKADLNILETGRYWEVKAQGWKGILYAPSRADPVYTRTFDEFFTGATKLPSIVHPVGLDEMCKAAIESIQMDPALIQKVVQIWVDQALSNSLYGYTVSVIQSDKVHEPYSEKYGGPFWFAEETWLSK
jgi:peptide/nickel transport system substrate-binding protein